MSPDTTPTSRTEQDWLEFIRTSILRGDLVAAQGSVVRALAEHPRSVELLRSQAGIYQKTGRVDEAESLLYELLGQNPGDVAAVFALAQMLLEQGRTAGAAAVMRACFTSGPNLRDPDLVINAIELLNNFDRKRDASAITEAAIAANPADPRLYAYAGMLAIQVGEFERARQHYLFALAHDDRAYEWHVPIGLASTLRYPGPDHPDFTLFSQGLQRPGLSSLALAELHFSLGKAYDDTGDYDKASRQFREGNAIRHRLARKWSRKHWRRSVEARLAAPPISTQLDATPGFTPIFIVGMPRSGTTLLAELLSRRAGVCNRGELATLHGLATSLELGGVPEREALQRAAAKYAQQSRQDDASGARWFLDKQPLNFRYVDLALALFPDAKIIHCQRNPRDTALSLWMQCFLEDAQGYSYDFSDIALVMRDATRMMRRWHARHPTAIQSIRYEEMVVAPQTSMTALGEWLGLPDPASRPTAPTTTSTISTASLWQARQPVNTRSVGRWQHYAAFVPELLQIPEV